jgi:hypothetical protein
MTSLRLSDALVLPLDAVTEKLGWLGRTGSGKTYGAQKLAEEMHHVGAQFVALDPVGKWWALRLGADGKTPAISVPVFGGLHGDVPLEYTAGKLMADVIIDRGISAVVDVSQFESDAAKARFMADFGNRFFFRKKAAPSAVHLFLEEAQEFVPQNPQRDEAVMLHAWTRIQKLGRNFGIGTSLLSQRPQEINKKVLNQTELLFVFQLTGPHERHAVADWISEKGVSEDIAAELPKLKQGCPHVWSPAWLQISKVVHIRAKETYDASSTPTVGRRADVKALAPIDLEKLRTDMAATIERAKAEDPRELRRQIADLRAALAKVQKAEPAPAAPQVVEVPVLRDGHLAQLEKAIADLDDVRDRMAQAQQVVVTELGLLRDAVLKAARPGQSRGTPPPQLAPPIAPMPWPARPIVSHHGRSQTITKGAEDLGKGERIILTAVAQYPEGASREQLTVLTGYRRSSRDTYLQRLSQQGLVSGNGRGDLVATVAGIAALGDDFTPLPTGPKLQSYWLNRLTGGERTILETLIRAYPKAVDRERLSEATEYKRSSRDTYLQRLTARRLVVPVGRGEVRASEMLMEA